MDVVRNLKVLTKICNECCQSHLQNHHEVKVLYETPQQVCIEAIQTNHVDEFPTK